MVDVGTEIPLVLVPGIQGRWDDMVGPCDETMCYLDLISGSSFQLFAHTRHLGTVLAPDRFAAIVSRFCRVL